MSRIPNSFLINNNVQNKSDTGEAMYFLIVDDKSNPGGSSLIPYPYTLLQQNNISSTNLNDHTIILTETDDQSKLQQQKKVTVARDNSKKVIQQLNDSQYVVVSDMGGVTKNAECIVVSDSEENAEYVEYEVLDSDNYLLSSNSNEIQYEPDDSYAGTENNVIFVNDESEFTTYTTDANDSTVVESGSNNLNLLYQCSVCNKIQKGSENLRKHILTEHTSMVNVFECNMCSRTFATEEFLQKHLKFHAGQSFYKCNLCDRKFTKEANLNYHRTTFHQAPITEIQKNSVSVEKYTEMCEKGIIQKNYFSCLYCSDTFDTFTELKNHAFSVHANTSQVPNNQQQQQQVTTPVKVKEESVLPTKSAVENKEQPRIISVRETDVNEKMYIDPVPLFRCNICSKKFAALDALKTHEKTHIGEQNFQCEFMQYINSKWDSGK